MNGISRIALFSLALSTALLVVQPAAAQNKEPKYRGRALSEWIDQLKDLDKNFRLDAAEALERFGPRGKPAVPALTEALKDESSIVRFRAAIALLRIDPPNAQATRVLVDALKNKDAFGGRETYRSVAQTAVPALISALKDKNEEVRKRAAEALKEIDPDAAKKAGVP